MLNIIRQYLKEQYEVIQQSHMNPVSRTIEDQDVVMNLDDIQAMIGWIDMHEEMVIDNKVYPIHPKVKSHVDHVWMSFWKMRENVKELQDTLRKIRTVSSDELAVEMCRQDGKDPFDYYVEYDRRSYDYDEHQVELWQEYSEEANKALNALEAIWEGR